MISTKGIKYASAFILAVILIIGFWPQAEQTSQVSIRLNDGTSSPPVTAVTVTPSGGSAHTFPSNSTPEIQFNNNESYTFSAPAYRSIDLTAIDIHHLNKITVTLYTTEQSDLNPTIRGTCTLGSSTSSVNVICGSTQSGQTPLSYTVRRRNTQGYYPPIIFEGQNNSVEISVEPESTDEHAKIDVVFDDSQINILNKYRGSLWRLFKPD